MQTYTWIYSLEESLTDEKKLDLDQAFDSFLSKWKSHGVPVRGLIQIKYNRFILIQSDSGEDRPSGCSIDNLKRTVSQILAQHSLTYLDGGYIFYRSNQGNISFTHFKNIPALLEKGELTQDTIIFDHSLGQSDDLSKWEITLKDSWMKRYLPTKLNS